MAVELFFADCESKRRIVANREGALVTDDGMENKGKLEEGINKPGMLWKKLIAQIDIIQSNSMVEAANKILKYHFLYPKPVADTEELIIVQKKQ